MSDLFDTITQRELAVRLGVTQGTISAIETGERRVDVVEFYRIGRALGICPTRMFQAATAEIATGDFVNVA